MSDAARLGQKSNRPLWLRGLTIQARVVHALALREALRKHGHHNLGFFWIIGEPMFLMVGIMFVWSLGHMTHGSDVAVIPFALTGYSFLTLWRHIAGQSAHTLRHNITVRYFSQVKPLDCIIARILLELCAIFATFMVCYIPLALLGYCGIMNDPLLLISGFLLCGWFSFGVALILAGLSEISDVVKNVVGAVMYITLPLTGVFTMQEWLPGNIRDILAWSPLVNCIEMIRGGLFGDALPTHWDAVYTVIWCCVVTIIGLQVIRYADRFVES